MAIPDYSIKTHRCVVSKTPIAYIELKYGANLVSWPRQMHHHGSSNLIAKYSFLFDPSTFETEHELTFENYNSKFYPGMDNQRCIGAKGQEDSNVYYNQSAFVGLDRNKYGKGMINEVWSDLITPWGLLSTARTSDGSPGTEPDWFKLNENGEPYPGDEGVISVKSNKYGAEPGDPLWNSGNIYTDGVYVFSDVENPGPGGDTYFFDGKPLSGGSFSKKRESALAFQTKPLSHAYENGEYWDWDVNGDYFYPLTNGVTWYQPERGELEESGSGNYLNFGCGLQNRAFWVWCDNPNGDTYPVYSPSTQLEAPWRFKNYWLGEHFNSSDPNYYHASTGTHTHVHNPWCRIYAESGPRGNEISYPLSFDGDVHNLIDSDSDQSIVDIKNNTVSCFQHIYPGMTGYKHIGSMRKLKVSDGLNVRTNENGILRVFNPKDYQLSWMNARTPEQLCDEQGISYFPPINHPIFTSDSIVNPYISSTPNYFQKGDNSGGIGDDLDWTTNLSYYSWNFDHTSNTILPTKSAKDSEFQFSQTSNPTSDQDVLGYTDHDNSGFLMCAERDGEIVPLYYTGVDSDYWIREYLNGVTAPATCAILMVHYILGLDSGIRKIMSGGGLGFLDNRFWTNHPEWVGETMKDLFPRACTGTYEETEDFPDGGDNFSRGNTLHKTGNGGYVDGDKPVIFWYNRQDGLWYNTDMRLTNGSDALVTIPNYDENMMGTEYQYNELDLTGDGTKQVYWSNKLEKKV